MSDYTKLKAFLETPLSTVFDPCELRLTNEPSEVVLHNIFSVENLLVKLSSKQKILCAITAAEMVLSYWINLGHKYNHLPQEAIELAYECKSRENSTVSRYSHALYLRSGERRKLGDSCAENAILAAVNALWNSTRPNCWQISLIVRYAAKASGLLRPFYKKWWRRCETRLAFVEADKAVIEWRHPCGVYKAKEIPIEAFLRCV